MNRIAFVLSLLLTSSAGAHDYWLVPETFTPKEGATLSVRMVVGEHFKPEQEVAYSAKRSAAVQLASAKKTVTEFPLLKDGAKPAFAFKLDAPNTSVLRVDRDWSSITLAADKFAAYLKEEGLDEVAKARAAAGEANADGKERYRRCLKAILHAGAPDDTPTKAVGQVFEIVPAKNPYALKAGDELPVAVLFDGKPLAGLKLTAWHRDGDTLTAATATTDKDGKASLKLAKSGPWVVRAVHMRRVAEKNPTPAADWESFWASVTFALP